MKQALLSVAIAAVLMLAGVGFAADLAGNYSVVSEFPPECGCGFVGNLNIQQNGDGYKVYFSIDGTICEPDRHVGDANPVPLVAEAYEIPSANNTFVYLVSTSPGRIAIIESGFPYCAGVAESA